MTLRAELYLVDKPTGPTSHAVVQQLRRWTGFKRVGHGGTLDPMATGLLPVYIGGATRLIEYLADHRKSYRATVQLGIQTETDDAEGTVVSERPVPPLTHEDLDHALHAFRGEINQVPPRYSAVKIAGVPAHRAARRGEVVEIAPRTVHVHKLTIDAWTSPILELRMTVSTGTYVRALARDLGEALGCGAYVTAMRRTQIGPVAVAEAQPLEALEAAFAAGHVQDLAVSPLRFLEHWPRVLLSDQQRRRIFNGQAIAATAGRPDASHMLALTPDGNPMAVLVPKGSWPERWRPVKVLAPRLPASVPSPS